MTEDKGDSSINSLRYGMVGGGPGSFIGDVHRKAAKFDGKADLVAGAFSRTYDKTLMIGRELGLDRERLYKDFEEMAKEEAARDRGIDFVSIVTPNSFHYQIAKTFLEKGIHVVCDKPLTVEVDQAEELAKLSKEKDLLFCVTYTYSGYPMVKQARQMVHKGEIGEIRFVQVEYPQEWLATPVEKEGNKQAAWRTDPQFSGKSNCVGDIGTHIENTVSYVTGLEIDSLCAKLDIFGKGRELDDNAEILLRYTSGASGVYWCSQIAVGHDNGLKFRIFGTKGSIEWEQENPNYLQVAYIDRPAEIMSRGRDELHPLASQVSRIPAGHPEGYYEAFSNIYSNFVDALLAKKAGEKLKRKHVDFPGVEDGVMGVKFIHHCVESSKKGSTWVDFKNH